MMNDSKATKYARPARSRIFGNRIKRSHYYQQVYGPLDGLDENAEGLSFACEADDEDEDDSDSDAVTPKTDLKGLNGTRSTLESEGGQRSGPKTVRQHMREYLQANFHSDSSEGSSSDSETSATDAETLFVQEVFARRAHSQDGDSCRLSDERVLSEASTPNSPLFPSDEEQMTSPCSSRTTKPNQHTRHISSSDSEPETPIKVAGEPEERRTSTRISVKLASNSNVECCFNDLMVNSQPAAKKTKKRLKQENMQTTSTPSTQEQRHIPVVLSSPREPQFQKFIPETPPRDLEPGADNFYTGATYDVMNDLPPSLRPSETTKLVKHEIDIRGTLRKRPLISKKRRAAVDPDPWRVPSSSESERGDGLKEYESSKTAESGPGRDQIVGQPRVAPHETPSINTSPSPLTSDATAAPAVLISYTAPEIAELSPPRRRLWNVICQFADASVASILTELDLGPEDNPALARLRLWYYLKQYSDETADRMSKHLQNNITKRALHASISVGRKRKREDSMIPSSQKKSLSSANTSGRGSAVRTRGLLQSFSSGIETEQVWEGKMDRGVRQGVGRKRQRSSK